MDIIDDRGRLLGLINIIDAVVVLIVVAAVIAGAAFLSGQGSNVDTQSLSTQNATLDLGSVQPYVVREIAEGETIAGGDGGELVITDVYVGPQNSQARAVLAVNVAGRNAGSSVSFQGVPIRVGSEVTLSTDTYEVTGTTRSIRGSLATNTTDILVEETVSASTAAAINEGDRITLAGRQIATVESVSVYGTNQTQKHQVHVGLSVRTVNLGIAPQYGGYLLHPNGRIPIQTNEYAFTGTIERVGATQLPGEPGVKTVTLQLREISPVLADSIEVGMAESFRGRTVAEVTAVQEEPASVVVQSKDGTLHEQAHPILRDVTITAELTVRETSGGPTFKGRRLQAGQKVTLDLGGTTVKATVVSFSE